MRMLGVAWVLVLSSFLAACNSAPAPQMSAEGVRALKLVAVEVRGGENVRSWPDEEQAAIAKGLLSPDEVNRLASTSASEFPPLHPHFQAVLQQRFESQLRNQMGPLLNGSQPVKAVVTVKLFDLPSVMRRVMIDQQGKLQADIELVDIKSGKSLVKYEGPFEAYYLLGGGAAIVAAVAQQASGGGDHSHYMSRDYVLRFKTWLFDRGT